MFTHYKDMKGNTKCRNWGGLGLWSSKITGCDAAHTTFHLTLIQTIYRVSVLYHFRVIASHLSKVTYFNLPHVPMHLNLAPLLGWPHSRFAEIFGFRKLDSLGYRVTLLSDSTFGHFETIPTCDW